MLKVMSNSVLEAITYCGKEGSAPIYNTDSPFEDLISKAPAWVPVSEYKQKTLPKSAVSKDMDSDWRLTYANIVPKAINHARAKGLTGGLKEIVGDLVSTTRWKPSFHMRKNGVPDS